jgi:metal-dependent HD superfamily phosphatase/phosphodiesterase
MNRAVSDHEQARVDKSAIVVLIGSVLAGIGKINKTSKHHHYSEG